MISLVYSATACQLFILSAKLFILFAGMSLHLYAATSAQFELMCNALRRSECLCAEIKAAGASTLYIRSMRVSIMAAVLLWPKFFISRGELNEDDYLDFPRGLAMRIRIAWYLMTIATAWILLAS